MSPFVIPLGLFAMVVLIVAISEFGKMRNLEVDYHQRLHQAEIEHQQKMRELELRLQRIKQGA